MSQTQTARSETRGVTARASLLIENSTIKMHWLEAAKPACGQQITSWSMNAIDRVTCKKCQAIISRRGLNSGFTPTF